MWEGVWRAQEADMAGARRCRLYNVAGGRGRLGEVYVGHVERVLTEAIWVLWSKKRRGRTRQSRGVDAGEGEGF